MASKDKKHRAMGDEEWMSRLRRTLVWIPLHHTWATTTQANFDFGLTHPTPDAEPLAAHLMSAAAVAASQPGWLPAKLRTTVPPQDQKWIAAALWKNKRLRSDLMLWYNPPLPAIIYHQVPAPERFFTHRLLVWMPYHLWKVRLSCPACRKQLTGYGAHKRARKVLDVDNYYLMITETLWCNACKIAYISSSKTILDQLDMPTRMEFTPILTQRYACDIRVIVSLRDRTQGNSPSRLVRQLRENHSREWIRSGTVLNAYTLQTGNPCSLSCSRRCQSRQLSPLTGGC
ncbi:uncharacterized protein LOC128460596 [Pleuronectes platessa]|uniref:uncharacterized protein LOC128460596 n=1 Tax=Pleuronectes platessa TaxID=8262 RepID=UPI00232A72F1|nr:uncharacterized protein LOC128460596 [Pleuronectes platessa]